MYANKKSAVWPINKIGFIYCSTAVILPAFASAKGLTLYKLQSNVYHTFFDYQGDFPVRKNLIINLGAQFTSLPRLRKVYNLDTDFFQRRTLYLTRGVKFRSTHNKKSFEALKAENKSSVYYHIKEVKLRTCYLGFSFLITFLSCYYYSFEILYLFVKPFLSYEKNFIFTDLTEAFYTTIQLNFIVSIYLLIPFIIYQFWCFIIPSSFVEERRKYNFFCTTMLVLLGFSLVFVYFLVLPELYKFLLHFEINTNFMSIQLEARIQSYVQLACKIFFSSSIIFQMPLFFFVAFEYGIINIDFLIQNRPQIMFANLLLAAFLSPPDLITQILLAVCLQLAFEFLLLLTFIYKKLKK
jgi:sec-independent protein translocase protein TatC